MPITKITKTKWALALLLMATVLAIPLIRSRASNNHQPNPQQTKDSLPPLLADGATDPSAIPDLIAIEILFKSVSVTDNDGNNETERSRAKAFIGQTKLAADKAEKLTAFANNFRESIRDLDAQAMNIKDRHWPKPGPEALNQLSALQKQKEAALNRVFTSLLENLNDEDKGKLFLRLQDIKRNVKVYQGLPVEAYQKQ